MRTGAETSNFRALAGLEKKNDTDLVSFFFQARDGDRTRKAFLAEMPEIREMLINIGFAETSEIRYVR